MDLDELKSTHEDYKRNEEKWSLYKSAYEGTESLVEDGYVLNKHERESEQNHDRRKKNAYGYNFTRRLATLINSLLSQKKPTNDYGQLDKNELFNFFLGDCDYNGTDLEKWLLDQQLFSLITGHTGVLIDYRNFGDDSEQLQRSDLDNVKEKVYPYLSAFSALNILDWEQEIINGVPTLTYIKVMDDCCKYRLWWRNAWEVWVIEEEEPKLESQGVNQLGVVPFVWLLHGHTNNKYIGDSAVKEIVRIDRSIIENLSHGEDVIEYSAFPMMRKPALSPGEQGNDIVGTSGVLEFDPMHPESKPDWLASETREPITAILEWIDSKIVEMARMFYASAFFSQSKAAISGESRKREFQLMNSVLAAESNTLEVFQRNIIYIWLLWIGKPELMDDVTIVRPMDFDISDKADELDALVISKTSVNSLTFSQEVDKKISRLIMPDMQVTVAAEVDKEIEETRELPEVEADQETENV